MKTFTKTLIVLGLATATLMQNADADTGRATVRAALVQDVASVTAQRAYPHAVTMWWVIFNAPENCTFNPGAQAQCGTSDVFGQAFLDSVANGAPDPALISPNLAAEIGVVYATGAVTGYRGNVKLAAAIYKADPGESMNLPPGTDPMGFGRGYEKEGAEVHLVVRDHGDVNRQDTLPQITNFLDPYCSDPNLLYFAGDNTCSDVHFAVFAPSETGSDRVYAFADPTNPVPGARAQLLRDGDVIRAVVDTRIDTYWISN